MNNQLTQARLKELLSYDPSSGIFRRISGKAEVGTVRNRRRSIGVDYKIYLSHRLAWLYVHGVWPKGDIDHIDGNPLNNAISNLRDVSRSVNMQNVKRPRKDSQTGLMGASLDKRTGRYMSYICLDGATKYLGTFNTAEEANSAYMAAKRQIHPGCTI